MNINKKELEKHRKIWINVAKQNNWYKDNFFIQVWIDINSGKIIDSVSFIGLNKDIICNYENDEIIKIK